MSVFLIILHLLVTIKFVFLAVLELPKSIFSQSELKRRAEVGEAGARLGLKRYKNYRTLLAVQKSLVLLALVASAWLAVVVYGWLWGVLVTVALVLLTGLLSRWDFLVGLAGRLYARYENKLLKLAKRSAPFVGWLAYKPETEELQIGSAGELVDLVERSPEALNSDQVSAIKSLLAFDNLTVQKIMTQRKNIKTVAKTETLGPVVLDDLHKTGHSQIPVVAKNLDSIVGVLQLRDLLVIDSENRPKTVEKAMQTRVFHIQANDKLSDALATMLNTNSTLLIVLDSAGKTAGLVTLSDVVGALIGKRFDSGAERLDL